MRTAVLLSLIAAARAFAPPSILRASVVVKNEADSASTVPESHISVARRVVMPRALAPRFDAVAAPAKPSTHRPHEPVDPLATPRRTPPAYRQYTLHPTTTQCTGGFRYDNSDSVSPLEKKQALQETASWCLERCIKLGHCEVFEDLNKMSTAQVQDFCKACVLTGEATQDECDVSMMFIEDGPWASIDRAAVGV